MTSRAVPCEAGSALRFARDIPLRMLWFDFSRLENTHGEATSSGKKVVQYNTKWCSELDAWEVSLLEILVSRQIDNFTATTAVALLLAVLDYFKIRDSNCQF